MCILKDFLGSTAAPPEAAVSLWYTVAPDRAWLGRNENSMLRFYSDMSYIDD